MNLEVSVDLELVLFFNDEMKPRVIGDIIGVIPFMFRFRFRFNTTNLAVPQTLLFETVYHPQSSCFKPFGPS